jgi:hypothetical protein
VGGWGSPRKWLHVAPPEMMTKATRGRMPAGYSIWKATDGSGFPHARGPGGNDERPADGQAPVVCGVSHLRDGSSSRSSGS